MRFPLTRRLSLALILSTPALALPLAPAHASSDDAWSQFRADVGRACTAAAKSLIADGRVLVDPYGSEHHGLAVITGKAVSGKATISTICVYDKQTKKAEIGGEIPADRLLVKARK